MQLHIYTPWRQTEDEALLDQAFLIKLFDLKTSYGHERHSFEDGFDHRADCYIDSKDLVKAIKKQK